MHSPATYSRSSAALQPLQLTPLMVSGLLFPVNEAHPMFVSVQYRIRQSTGNPRPSLESLFRGAKPQKLIITHRTDGTPLTFPLHVYHSAAAQATAACINSAIQHTALMTMERCAFRWCGVMVALRYDGARFVDAHQEDLEALVEYFCTYSP
ncbi:hypothetical protein FB45DRAFT_1022965 [Roridomyces roridus]|uniref:Uncharacterized protein n=1 Tax=Roridomyces roridus TaxID=1738132 RepID=A0AAD7FWA4_9AGAR|nr:hypothetical protein FB45DRAFT_1022965 [Roridomyces roridus]